MVKDGKIEHINIGSESLTVRNSEKDKNVSEVINILAEKPLNIKVNKNDDNNDVQSLLRILDLLEELYAKNSDEEPEFRHSYSNIFNTMVRLIPPNKNRIFSSENNKLENLSNNTQWLKEILDKKNEISIEKISEDKNIIQKIYNLQNNDKFNKGFFKLYDHILLEYARIAFSSSWIDRVEIAEKQLNSTNMRLSDLKKESNELREKSQKIQRDYVAILGIFSSIVITFVAGMVFSGSVLGNIDKASIYRLAFVMIMIGLLIFNLLNLLLCAIQKINDQCILVNKKERLITKINIILFSFLLIDIVMWCFYWYRVLHPNSWM